MKLKSTFSLLQKVKLQENKTDDKKLEEENR